jgi:hypothetical protein
VRRRLPLKKAFPGRELEQHDAEREHVAPSIEHVATGLLGRHVAEFPLDLVVPVGVSLERSVRDAEIDEPRTTVRADQNVVRGDVAVDEVSELAVPTAELVRRVKPGRRVGDDPHRELGRNGSALSRFAIHRAQGVALHPLHRHEEDTLVLADLVNANDVRVVDAADDLSLFEEHRSELGALCELRQHRLHRHQTVAHVARLPANPHGCHAAAPDLDEELVVAET